MWLIRKKIGFTLVELAASLGIAGSIALISAQEATFETSQDRARSLGNEIFLFNSGVSRFLAANAGDSSVTGTFSGSSWLKGADCSGGLASDNFISCDLLQDGATLQYGISPITTVSYSSDGSLSARTVWETIVGSNGNSDTMGMGLAALVASGNYISQHNDAASGYQQPTVYCPEVSVVSSSISEVCGSDRNVIISSAGLSSSVEPWLRTDHGNTMRHVIEFNQAGDRSTESELRAIEDRTGDSWLRQVVNVSRLYSGTGTSGESITIGSRSGNSIYGNSFLTSNNLLNGAVIMDGNVGVMNNLYVNAGAFVSGNLNVDGSIASGGNITSDSNILADSGTVRGSTVRSINDVISGRDVTATRNVMGQRFIDTNDTSKYMDPSSRSQIVSLTATGDIRASRFYDQDNTGYYVDPASTSRLNIVDANRVDSRGEVRGTLFRDVNNTDRYADPSSRSVFNALDVVNTGTSALRVTGRTQTGSLQVTSSASVGGSCTTGQIGRKGNGEILQCVSGTWREAGGGNFTTGSRIFKDPQSGFKIMWGRATPTTTVSFPECFASTNNFSVTASAGTNFEEIVSNITRCSFRLGTNGNRASSPWIAVGY